MHYTGWLLRYIHANGASMFFIVVFLHMFCGLYYASYSSPREFVRCIGVVIFLLMILTAFIGYVLPWGQISFWGATVITSLASAIPVVGDTIVTWLWGVCANFLHLAALHQYGSNNPLGVHAEMDKIICYPYFYVKDLVGWVDFAIFLSVWIFYASNVLGHPNNYIPANPMSTPAHIMPEWYFLCVAVIALVSICILSLPFMKSHYVRSSSWIGCQPVEQPFVIIGQISPIFFLLFFFHLVRDG
ncbi:hypothetical protein MKW98_030227 [Papaver atlanticum]|uniref:Cytochrome b n=1 Tax=Papaver atlanticum TaxID=357466 RepID=A0AAD4SYV1_9MAGN|nr:hypothetical protein MKW98_030227 [Papaver atlanticum]